MTRVVQNQGEQDGLESAWTETPIVIKKSWKDKVNEVFTVSGFQVREYHLEFLQHNGVANMNSLRDAGAFIDTMDEAQQEEFFLDAAEFQAETPAAPVADVAAPIEAVEGKGKKKK
jgi:predicted HAD superfamily phosphohydrolase